MKINYSFEEIYEKLSPLIYRFVIVRVPASEAEDLTAEIMVKVWRNLAGLKEKTSLQAWALSIAYHQIIDYYRSEKHIPVISANNQPDIEGLTPDHAEQLIKMNSIEETLTKLPASQVAVIQLRIVEGFSAAEVADILGTSKQAVDSLLYRAKKRFRKYYAVRNTGGKRL
ncbi:MAG TPA: sigma-70 family RNA polymerase sigma factor [Desulfitobacteriaceae bacterium]|nr:sigma-70 family RNA polymerase sigma factor [Desulfitobacteriaceae bacterium]